MNHEVAGWANHPAVLMWEKNPFALWMYVNAICDEWTSRGYQDTVKDKILALVKSYEEERLQFGLFQFTEALDPEWWGDDRVHHSHRSMLIKKEPMYYGPLFREDEFSCLSYHWPVRNTIK